MRLHLANPETLPLLFFVICGAVILGVMFIGIAGIIFYGGDNNV